MKSAEIIFRLFAVVAFIGLFGVLVGKFLSTGLGTDRGEPRFRDGDGYIVKD